MSEEMLKKRLRDLANEQVTDPRFALASASVAAERAALLSSSETAATSLYATELRAATIRYVAQLAADAFGYSHASLPIWDLADGCEMPPKKQDRGVANASPSANSVRSKLQEYVALAATEGTATAQQIRSTLSAANRPVTLVHGATPRDAESLLRLMHRQASSSASEGAGESDEDGDVDVAAAACDFIVGRLTRLEALLGVVLFECAQIMRQTAVRRERYRDDPERIEKLTAASNTIRYRGFLTIIAVREQLRVSSASNSEMHRWQFGAAIAAVLANVAPMILPFQPVETIESIQGVIRLQTPTEWLDDDATDSRRGALISRKAWSAVLQAVGLPPEM